MQELTRHDVTTGEIEDLLLQVLDDANSVTMVTVRHWHRKDGDQYLSVQVKLEAPINRKLLGMKFTIDTIQLYTEIGNKYMLQNANTLARWVDMFEGKYMFTWEVKNTNK